MNIYYTDRERECVYEVERKKKQTDKQTDKNEVQVPIYYVSEKKVEVVPEISSGSVRSGVVM